MVNLLAPGSPSDTMFERSASPSTGDLILDNAAVMLSALRKISSVSGVPFLNEAAIVAVRLVNLIRDVRDNNDGFRTLGMDAGKLVWTISTECERLAQAGKSVPQSVQDHIQALVTNLRAIEAFIESKMLRRKLQKIIAYANDKSEVLRYREVLRNALDSFAIQASIASQEALHHISERIDSHRVEVIFDRIHQTDTLNRLMQQQGEQMEQLRLTMVARYTEEDRLREEREYYARVEHEQQASVAALRAEEERQAEEERLREQEKKDAETARLRKRAAEKLKQMDQEEAERKKQRREQAQEAREAREAIAIVELQQEAEREEARRRKKQERQWQQEEEAAKNAAAAAEKEARVAAQAAEDAKEDARRRQQRKTEKQRRDEEKEHDEAPPRRKPAAGKGTHITATQVEITVTRKGKGGTTKATHKSGVGGGVAFDGEKFSRDLERKIERKIEREFEGFEAEFLDSSSDDDEYWSDDAPRKRRAKSKKAAKATARAGRPHSFVDVDALRAGIQDMSMQGVHSYAGCHSPYYPPPHGSPYMMPPPGPYPYDYVSSSNHAHATSISVSNVSNSAISFGDTPTVVRNSGNVRVVNISNVGNRY